MSDAVIWVFYGLAFCAGICVGAATTYLLLAEHPVAPSPTCPRSVP